MKKRTGSERLSYSSIGILSRVLAPVFGLLFYIAIIAAALCLICIPIIAVVKIPVDEMLLPPYMDSHGENDTVEYYDIFIGNGVSLTVGADEVDLSDIKKVLNAGLIMITLMALVLAPVFRFLSLLLKNISAGKLMNPKNADYVCYTAITVMAGSALIRFMSGYYNYLLISTFIKSETEIRSSLRPDWFGLLTGLLILLIGFIYGYECSRTPRLYQKEDPEKIITGTALEQKDDN